MFFSLSVCFKGILDVLMICYPYLQYTNNVFTFKAIWRSLNAKCSKNYQKKFYFYYTRDS